MPESLQIIAPYFVFILGAILGSFANVVIYRLPKEESVVFPGSHCGSCGGAVSWYDNVPILSWFILRGKCRKCGARFSIRYPFVELLMALAFLLTYQWSGFSWRTLELLIFVFGLVTVSFIDLDHMILPDEFTLGGIVIGLIGGLINPERAFLDSFLGVLFGGGFLWAIAYFYYVLRKEEGMGGGDIKLLGWIGAVLGWQAIPFVILSSSIIGSVIGVGVAIRNKKGMKTLIPFGPFLAIGAVLYIFGGRALADWYIHFFIPGL